ncbi:MULTISPECIES: family 16 glycosylhydrolase [unclassified Polaribacter]|uniref:glycoside hydrolase family 16 protein n=1 Tax=unclassified Polaribacter TaxID=196858 RepID=UPI001CB9133F|nr:MULTISPECIES: glycoside hydrolase family 16 protein [unclassified Polaribacter]
MKLNYIVVFLLLFMSSLINSQQMPLDFSETADSFIPFNGSGFSTRNDSNGNTGGVGQFYNDGTNAGQGFYLDVAVDLDIEQKITLSFYSFDPNPHNILLKLENGTNPGVEIKKSFTVPSPSNWKTISFDFKNANYILNGTNVSATGMYSRLVIVIDEGTTTAGAYLIDDVSDGSVATDPNVLDVIYTDLVWSDEFNTNGALDTNKWFHQTNGPNGGRWYNEELQHYTNRIENSFVSNGNLHIVAKKENFTQNGVTLNYTSARLNSKYAFTYGRMDVRAKLPFGKGTWPAIWTLGKNVNEAGAYWQTQCFGATNWPATGEIDIMEHGLHATNEVSSALHTLDQNGNTSNTATKTLPNVAENFHVYSMIWSPDQITFLIDDIAYYTFKPSPKNERTWPFDKDQFLLLNIAMGGFSGTPNANFTESSMLIDYVRIFQNNSLSVVDTFADKFFVYPNPSSNFITIKTNEKNR